MLQVPVWCYPPVRGMTAVFEAHHKKNFSTNEYVIKQQSCQPGLSEFI